MISSISLSKNNTLYQHFTRKLSRYKSMQIQTQESPRLEANPEQQSSPATKPFPTKLQVEVTTRCNMRCAMCVKAAPDSNICEADLDIQTFRKLAPALEHCEALVLNGIGEPLLHPDLAEMAAFARERMPEHGWIGFQTNGLLLTPKRADELVSAGVDTFCVSVDTLDAADSGGELHGQSSVARLERAFDMLLDAGERFGRKVRLGVEFVLMADTVAQLPKVVAWAADQGVSFAIGSHVLIYDEALEAQSLFNPNTPKSTALFNRWQKYALSKGVNLHDYQASIWKFVKTEQDHLRRELFRKFQEDARDEGIWANFRHLVQWSQREHQSKKVARLFREAELAAMEAGIELRLPPLQAREERHCHFIEDGVAFVTSQGDVSPCQYLWHQYACHLDGAKKLVKQWTFGNLAEADMGEIWRTKPYADFREEVTRYDYPYCSNCAFVPCDDITGTSYDFEYDCLGVEVPCGHCLWCMGGLQCLI